MHARSLLLFIHFLFSHTHEFDVVFVRRVHHNHTVVIICVCFTSQRTQTQSIDT